jgi:hypothetical protein
MFLKSDTAIILGCEAKSKLTSATANGFRVQGEGNPIWEIQDIALSMNRNKTATAGKCKAAKILDIPHENHEITNNLGSFRVAQTI